MQYLEPSDTDSIVLHLGLNVIYKLRGLSPSQDRGQPGEPAGPGAGAGPGAQELASTSSSNSSNSDSGIGYRDEALHPQVREISDWQILSQLLGEIMPSSYTHSHALKGSSPSQITNVCGCDCGHSEIPRHLYISNGGSPIICPGASQTQFFFLD